MNFSINKCQYGCILDLYRLKSVSNNNIYRLSEKIKQICRLYLRILIIDRFEKMNLSDKIRALFEGINLRILNESDILRPSIIEFFESLYTITEEDIIRMNVDKVLLTIV